jgi:ATPase subunit of ABC transporter with duplicated ATPase domains
MITGKEKPDSGTIKIGETVKLAYADQTRTLDPEKTVYEEISQGADFLELGKRKVNSRGYCSSFNFAGADQQKKVGVLSGGERNRVHLAKTLTEGANVLLLDEPTNDLDVNTLRALEESLEEYAGVAIVVSHDRWFLDRICTHIIAFEGESIARMYIGNWSDYEEMMMEKFGKDLQPHRVKYRQLKR